MITKEVLGHRIREVRNERRLTLKEVESISGFSSTHISEIERGHTSPTVGVLVRIASALKKDPAYFLEEGELEETCVTTTETRSGQGAWEDVQGHGYRLESLTRGIRGGRLQCMAVSLEPGGELTFSNLSDQSSICLYGLEGTVAVGLTDEAAALGPGCSLQGWPLSGSFRLQASGTGAASAVLVLDPR